MKNLKFIVPIIILFMVISSCEMENNAVEILSFEASDSFGLAGDTIMLYCVAEDGDGDKLGYSWETSSGVFSTKSDSTEWIPPFIEGTFLVTCKVSDGVGSSDARTIPIRVEVPTPVPINGLSWTLTDSGLLGGPNSSNDNNTGVTGYWDGTVEGADYGWNVTEQETPNRQISQSLQFKVENSANCVDNGGNPNTQEGRATADIEITGSDPVTLDIDFSGVGEAEDAGYDIIKFRLNGTVIGSGEAPGGGRGCQADSVVVNPAAQQILNPGSHRLVINFTTNDEKYHVDAYYEIRLDLRVQ